MWGRKILSCIAVAVALFVAGCVFGPAKFKGVIGYRPDGRVFLPDRTFYKVGVLPPNWMPMKTRARTISFYNPEYKSSISTDAFCGRSVGSQRIGSLGGEMVSALEGRTKISETKLELDGRGGVRQKVRGSLDGVDVLLDLVVVRKDECVFDFYAVTPPNPGEAVVSDFESFFSAFHYE